MQDGKPNLSGDNSPEVHRKSKSQQEQQRFVRKRKIPETCIKRDRCLNKDYLFKEKPTAPTAAVMTSGITVKYGLWKDSPCLSAQRALNTLNLAHLIAWAVHTSLILFKLSYDACQFRFILITTLMDEPRSWLTGCALYSPVPWPHQQQAGRVLTFRHAQPIIRPPGQCHLARPLSATNSFSVACLYFVSLNVLSQRLL